MHSVIHRIVKNALDKAFIRGVSVFESGIYECSIWYVECMTVAPEPIKEAQEYLHDITNLEWNSLGIIGSQGHKNTGTSYHLGKDDLKLWKKPYSVYESSRDERGLSNDAAALDIGYFNLGDGKNLRTFSLWLVEQCKAGASDTEDIREIIYSPDGETVLRWDRLGKRESGDSSHRSHTHLSAHRDATRTLNWVRLFKRFFAGSSAPKPTIPAGDPAPKPHYDFPLPNHYYFGPKDGPNSSVSGHYKRRFGGVLDSTWLKRFGSQLQKRGWNARKGGSYLTRYGNDGLFGGEYEALVRAFQRDQGLVVDGKLGPNTWKAAFENPIS